MKTNQQIMDMRNRVALKLEMMIWTDGDMVEMMKAFLDSVASVMRGRTPGTYTSGKEE